MHRFANRTFLTTTVVLALLMSTTTVSAASSNGRSAVPGTVPPWAKAANLTGPAKGTDGVGFRLYLGWRNESNLTSFIQSVSDPRSRSYGKYLSPAQFRSQYAPSAADAASVASWLRSEGFTVNYTPANNHYVSAEGTVAQAQNAFGVSFGAYKVNGMTLRAPTSDITVPSSLAAAISGEIGLDESAALVRTDHAGVDPDGAPPAAFANAPPCSTYWDQKDDANTPTPAVTSPAGYANPLPWAPCGYTPQQVRSAYVGSSSLDGTGQTIGIIDAYASPTILQDANQWSANRGIPQFGTSGGGTLTQVVAPGVYNVPENPRQDPSGWSVEESLDVESEHGMAPNANIVYVGSPNNYQDLDAAMNHFVDNKLGQIVSNSYGFPTEALPSGFITPFEETLMQGAAEGIGIYFSSGDNSDESQSVGYITADWPASSPLVTAVGGTSIAVGSSNNYEFETGWGTRRSRWNSSCATANQNTWCPAPPGVWLYGAGGGVSCLFSPPSYQTAAGVSRTAPSGSLCPGFNGRAVPDVGAIADPNTGYLMGMTQSFPGGPAYGEFREGGTSLASPIFAGLMALSDEALGHPHGFANPAFYSDFGAFRDVVNPSSTVGVLRNDYCNSLNASQNCAAAATFGVITSLRTMNQTLSLQTAAGWDDVTGIGTPNGSLLSLP
jgi:subtilase family serine protease